MSIMANYFDIIPGEIFIEIFKNFSFNELIKSELISKTIQERIRTNGWNHMLVKTKKMDKIEYLAKNYQFRKYDLSESLITDNILKQLDYCQFLPEQRSERPRSDHTLLKSNNKLCLLLFFSV